MVAAAQARSKVQRPTYFANFIIAAHRNSTQVELDRSPYSVVPESPHTGGRVPHQLSPRRRRRWRWWRRRPRRRGPPGPRARRTTLACRTLPVVAVIPVPVVGSGPSPGSIDRPGTSDCWAQGRGPPEPWGRPLARNRTTPTRRPPARCQTTESVVLPSPSLKNFPQTGIKQSMMPIQDVR